MFVHKQPLLGHETLSLYIQEPPKNLHQQNYLLIFSRCIMVLKNAILDASVPGGGGSDLIFPRVQLSDITTHPLCIKNPTLGYPQSMRNQMLKIT